MRTARRPTGLPGTGPTTAQLGLPVARLTVGLRDEQGTPFLAVQSTVDPQQGFLLPLATAPVCAGLGLLTRLGRLHALYWGLAYGVGPVGPATRVRFETARLRYATSCEVPVHALGAGCWVAEAGGTYDRVVLLEHGVEVAAAPLADRW